MKKLLFTGLISVGFALNGAEQGPFKKEKERLLNYVEYVHSKGWNRRDTLYTFFPSLLKGIFFLKRPKISCSYINSLPDDDFEGLKFDILCFLSFDVPYAKAQDDAVEGELRLLVDHINTCRIKNF